MRGGVLSTAGSLVFQGSGTGIFSAYRATDGVELWSFDARTPIIAAPVTVQLDDRQLVIVSTGNLTSAVARGLSSLASKDGLNDPPRLLAFRIGAGTTLPRQACRHHSLSPHAKGQSMPRSCGVARSCSRQTPATNVTGSRRAQSSVGRCRICVERLLRPMTPSNASCAVGRSRLGACRCSLMCSRQKMCRPYRHLCLSEHGRATSTKPRSQGDHPAHLPCSGQ